MIVQISQPFEAVFTSGVSGQVGTVEVAVIDNDGVVVIGPTTNDITEAVIDGVNTGLYTWNCPAAPAAVGQFTIAWSIDGLWDPETLSTPDELLIVSESTDGLLPPIPADDDVVPPFCFGTAWTTSYDVSLCCSAEVGTDYSIFDSSVSEASQVLFELSGRRFLGECQKTVRPCSQRYCGFQVLSRGHVIGWDDRQWSWADTRGCGCHPLSTVLLSGYPVREITQVKINGDVVDSATYRLDERRYLTRVRDPLEPDVALYWPSCQWLDLPDTEDGTFSVTYTYGINPPLLGKLAAAEFACELYKSCIDGVGDCALPTGTTRVIRQGVVIERLAFSAWGLQTGIWRTGLPKVDAFLNAYNPHNLRRRPSTWGPDGKQYARSVGV